MNKIFSIKSGKINLNFFHSLRFKLIVLFLIVSLVPLMIVGTLSYIQAKEALEHETINKLSATRDIKIHQIEAYFKERIGDLDVFAHNLFLINAVTEFEEAIHNEIKINGKDNETQVMEQYQHLYAKQPNLNSAGNSNYDKVHEKYHPYLKRYLDTYGYYDIFLVEPNDGTIIYSVMKEKDFGTSLKTGIYANSNIGHIFKQTIISNDHDFTALEDFAFYEPSNNAAAFLAAPIWKNDNDLIGVLIFQVSTAQINRITQEKSGLGETGETILVGSDDFLMRSNSPLSEEPTLFKQKVDSKATRASALGQTGIKKIIDYRNKLTFIAHAPLNIPGVNWSLNSKMDVEEATAVTEKMFREMLIITIIGAIIVAIIAFFLSSSIANPIQLMTKIASKLAEGDIKQNIEFNRSDEIGVMGQAFRQMIINLRIVIEDIVYVSQGLANGKLNVTPEASYKGDFIEIKESLEIALATQRKVIEDIVPVSQGLANGNLAVQPQAEYPGDFNKIKGSLERTLTDLRAVIADIVNVSQGLAEGKEAVKTQTEYRGDFAKIKEALESAGIKLATTTEYNTTQDWLKTGQNQLNDQMSGDQNIIELTHNVVSFLTLYLQAQVGICYVVDDSIITQERKLKLVTSYAHTRRKNISEEFEFTKGMVERSAKELKVITMELSSDLGEDIPPYILITPFLHENILKGVLLIASLNKITEIQQKFLQLIMPSIGVSVNAVEAREKMQLLLNQTQEQSEELRNQQEELKQSNEELQSQQEELQSQTEELQTQTEELRQTNEELETRTQDLENQRKAIRDKNTTLEKTQEVIEAKAQELELASKYKSEFLANMSHELRTPLNSMLILAQLLTENKQNNLSDKQVEYARTIHSAGSDLLALINEILDLSKVEAGKIEANIEKVFIADLMETLEPKFSHAAEEKGVAFEINLAETLPDTIRTDAQRLKQIINNLLSNAFKFTSKGSVKLDIQRPDIDVSMYKLDNEKSIQIAVTDSGIGIPNDKQKVIFEAFQQADGTTSRRFGGTGLGLSISRQLARLLGGELKLVSEEGKGSKFSLYIPESLEPKSSESMEVNHPSPSPSASLPASSAPKIAINNKENEESGLEFISETPIATINDDRDDITADSKSLLIVEDDRNFSRLVMELAQEKGFKCILAEDGKIGLECAEYYQPRAIILDMGLPKIDGWTMMEILKNNPETRHIPVHFISANDQTMDARKMGAIGYLLKPVSMEQLGEAFLKIEHFIAQKTKNLLIVVDNEEHQQAILKIVGNDSINITVTATKDEAMSKLHIEDIDCIILDVDVEDKSGIRLLEKLNNEDSIAQIPIILYSERRLLASEEEIIQKCTNHLTVKTVQSPERLLDETTLFLHQLEANLPKEKREMLEVVHDKEAILRDKKVLIVDDDVRNVFALATVLEDKDMEVVVGKDGEQGLKMLEEVDDIAIVLMDIMMPGMDGYEAMQRIRKQARHRHLPIIALTAKAMKGDKAKCIDAGANDYLSKPVDTNKLLSLMRVWLYR